MSEALPEELLHLIIRFSASIPDLPLTVSSPLTTTTLSLKQLIRSHLPDAFASNRLRLIYAGKALQDATPLSSSLKWIPPPSRDTALKSNGAEGTDTSDKGKGKAPVREGNKSDPAAVNAWVQRVYIHCSIGDELSIKELDSEATLAANLETSLASQNATNNTPHTPGGDSIGRRASAAAPAAPQGFDRLLNAGFNATDVASLRSQFITNLAFTHTPDTMPTGATLRALEDSWLDSSAQDDPAAMVAGETEGEGGGWGFSFSTEDGGLDDILWGNLIGFFWPIGALVLGLREEGVWTTRRKLVVISGILVNVVFGMVKWSS